MGQELQFPSEQSRTGCANDMKRDKVRGSKKINIKKPILVQIRN